jgi:hypothetical protein
VIFPVIEPANALAGAMENSRKQARATAQNLDFNSASVDWWNRARRPTGPEYSRHSDLHRPRLLIT